MENQNVRKRTQSRAGKKRKEKRDNSMAWVNIFGILILSAIIYVVGSFMRF